MAYIVKVDIENVFGVVNVAKWSNLDNQDDAAAPNLTRINAAIAYADEFFDSRMRTGVYTLPIASPSLVVKDIIAKLAGVWLYESRGIDDFEDDEEDTISRHKRWAEQMIDRIQRGEIGLTSEANGDHPTSPVVVVT